MGLTESSKKLSKKHVIACSKQLRSQMKDLPNHKDVLAQYCIPYLHDVQFLTCFRWFFRIVHSGSGKDGISSQDEDFVILLASRSTNHTSSGSLMEACKERATAKNNVGSER